MRICPGPVIIYYLFGVNFVFRMRYNRCGYHILPGGIIFIVFSGLKKRVALADCFPPILPVFVPFFCSYFLFLLFSPRLRPVCISFLFRLYFAFFYFRLVFILFLFRFYLPCYVVSPFAILPQTGKKTLPFIFSPYAFYFPQIAFSFFIISFSST